MKLSQEPGPELQEREKGKHTSSLAAADSAVGRVIEVATNVANLGVEKALAGKVLPVQMLRSPEAARCDGAQLRIVRNGGGS